MDLSMRGRSGCESESLPFLFSIYRRAPTKHHHTAGDEKRGDGGERKKTQSTKVCKPRRRRRRLKGGAHTRFGFPKKNPEKANNFAAIAAFNINTSKNKTCDPFYGNFACFSISFVFVTCAIPVTEIGTPCVELTWFEVTFKVITFKEILGEKFF